MKFRLFLGISLFVLGVFYWSLKEYHFVIEGDSTSRFDSFYSITGDESATIEILKELDKKGIEYAAEHQLPFNEVEHELTKQCLEDWLDDEITRASH